MPVPEVGDTDEVVDTITLYGIKVYELQRFGYDNLYDAPRADFEGIYNLKQIMTEILSKEVAA